MNDDEALIGRIELEAPPEPRTWLVIENPIPRETAERLRHEISNAVLTEKWPVVITGLGRCYWITEGPPAGDA